MPFDHRFFRVLFGFVLLTILPSVARSQPGTPPGNPTASPFVVPHRPGMSFFPNEPRSSLPLFGDRPIQINPKLFGLEDKKLQNLLENDEVRKMIENFQKKEQLKGADKSPNLLGSLGKMLNPGSQSTNPTGNLADWMQKLGGDKNQADTLTNLLKLAEIKSREQPRQETIEEVRNRSLNRSRASQNAGDFRNRTLVTSNIPGETNMPRMDETSESEAVIRWLSRNFGEQEGFSNILSRFQSSLKDAGQARDNDALIRTLESQFKDFSRWASRQNFRLPSLRNAPTLNFGGPDLSFGSAPAVSASSPITFIIGLIAAGFIVWYCFRKPTKTNDTIAPVQAEVPLPDFQIHAPEEFISQFDQCVEHLFGQQAVTWNHRRVESEGKKLFPNQAARWEFLVSRYVQLRYHPLREAGLQEPKEKLQGELQAASKEWQAWKQTQLQLAPGEKK